MKKSRLLEQVSSFLATLGQPFPGMVIAVSGGADSVALYRSIRAVCPPGSRLVVAHLNHQLRGQESDDDENFVRELVAKDMPLEIQQKNVRAIAGRDNLEAVARRERYAWFVEIAKKHDVQFVATGHNANDQAETVLHRLIRGTGLEGMRAIAPRRPLKDDVEVVRPLLRISRAEILHFLLELDQRWRHDVSNEDLRFTRNRIRHELLPLLAHDYNPQIVEVLGRVAVDADETFREVEHQTKAILTKVELPRAGEVVILDASQLQAYSRAQVRRLIRHVWQREGWPLGRMRFADYDRVAALVEVTQGAHDLPQGIRARRSGHVLRLMACSVE